VKLEPRDLKASKESKDKPGYLEILVCKAYKVFKGKLERKAYKVLLALLESLVSKESRGKQG